MRKPPCLGPRIAKGSSLVAALAVCGVLGLSRPAAGEDTETLGLAPIEALLPTNPLVCELVTASKEVHFGEAKNRRLDFLYRPVDRVELTYVPAGQFDLGLTDEALARNQKACSASGSKRCKDKDFGDERPASSVEVGELYVDKVETTVGSYDRCVQAGSCPALELSKCNVKTADGWVDGAPLPQDLTDLSAPRTCVEQSEAAAYCTWVGGRLPTEAEWEWVAKGATGRVYATGDELDRDVQFGKDVYKGSGGATPEGVLGLSGGVYEWTSSAACMFSDPLEGKEPICKGDTKGKGVIRGGSYLSDASSLRTTGRRFVGTGQRSSNVGFRCVMDSSPGYVEDVDALKVQMGVADFAAKGELLALDGVLWAGITVAGETIPLAAIGTPTVYDRNCVEVDSVGRFWWFDSKPAVILQLADRAWFWAMPEGSDCLLRWEATLEPLLLQSTQIIPAQAHTEEKAEKSFEVELHPDKGLEVVTRDAKRFLVKSSKGETKLEVARQTPLGVNPDVENVSLEIRQLTAGALSIDYQGETQLDEENHRGNEDSRALLVWDPQSSLQAGLSFVAYWYSSKAKEDFDYRRETIDSCVSAVCDDWLESYDRGSLRSLALVRSGGLLHFSSTQSTNTVTDGSWSEDEMFDHCACEKSTTSSSWSWVFENLEGDLFEVVREEHKSVEERRFTFFEPSIDDDL